MFSLKDITVYFTKLYYFYHLGCLSVRTSPITLSNMFIKGWVNTYISWFYSRHFFCRIMWSKSQKYVILCVYKWNYWFYILQGNIYIFPFINIYYYIYIISITVVIINICFSIVIVLDLSILHIEIESIFSRFEVHRKIICFIRSTACLSVRTDAVS